MTPSEYEMLELLRLQEQRVSYLQEKIESLKEANDLYCERLQALGHLDDDEGAS